MRPKKHETTRSGDLFRARLDQVINLKHELVPLPSDFDRLNPGQSSSGKCFGSTSISMLRATLGWPSDEPCSFER